MKPKTILPITLAAGMESLDRSYTLKDGYTYEYSSSGDPKAKIRSGKKPNYSESEMKSIKKRRNKNKAAKKSRKKNRR